MFNCGDLVVYGNNGVCCVEEITTLPSENADKDKLYYVLKHLSSSGMAYIPVDSSVYMRPVISKDEANSLIDKIPSVTTDMFDHIPPRELQKAYREALLSHDSVAILSLIKHIRLTAKRKQLLKKKLSSTEERFLEQAIKVIGSELAVALDIEMGSIREYIMERLNTDDI